MTKGKEELLDFIKLTIYQAIDDKEEKFNEICKKNVILHLQRHELDCPGRLSKLKSIMNWSAFTGVIGLVVEKAMSHFSK